MVEAGGAPEKIAVRRRWVMTFSLRDLSPESSRWCLRIETFLEDELLVSLWDKTLVLACSGGVDSIALLVFCRVMQERWRTKLVAAHLDHKLRPESSGDAQAVRAICSSCDIPFFSGSSGVRRYAKRLGLGLEEAGRRLRYRFLHGIRSKIGADLILTGHHLNDLAEDSLMRQLRGAGWPALAGMKAWDPAHKLLRPFLLTPKERLIRLVTASAATWREDASNQDLSFKRNRIRHNLIPVFLRENPNYLDCVAQLWRQARLDEVFWRAELERLIPLEEPSRQGISIPGQALRRLGPAQRLRWYRDILNRLGAGQTRAAALFGLERAWAREASGKTFQFPGNKSARITPHGIRFQIEGKD